MVVFYVAMKNYRKRSSWTFMFKSLFWLGKNENQGINMIIYAEGLEKCYAAFLILKEGDIKLKEEKDPFVLGERKRSYWWI